jgi:hypothetical protein
MKFTWEEKDVRGGRVVCQGSRRSIIGWNPKMGSGAFYLVELSDGALRKEGSTARIMAEILNSGGYAPEQLN